MKTCIAMRASNDMPVILETIEMLRRQDAEFELHIFDNESTDGTREAASAIATEVHTVPRGTYVPGKVLNRAMEATDGDVVVFLNSDCSPVDSAWLRNLTRAMADESLAAVFGRQVPRPGCHPIHARDIEDTYGDGSKQKYWRHCFSMASSALRRSVWETAGFREDIRYSEDIEWTWRVRGLGFGIRYVPDAVVRHSHDYGLWRFYRRHYGEGEAEARIFDWSAWDRSFVRYSCLPFVRQVLGDLKCCVRGGHAFAALQSPMFRLAQLLGRRAGFAAGWKKRRSIPQTQKEDACRVPS
jgi:rhamnosyltransferase